MAPNKPNAENINVVLIVDVDYVLEKHPNPSQNPASPTPLNEADATMYCQDNRGGVTGNGSSSITMNVEKFDKVSFFGATNLPHVLDKAILYNGKEIQGKSVFHCQGTTTLQFMGMQADPGHSQGIPARQVPETLNIVNGYANKGGQIGIYLDLALYVYEASSNSQVLKGYYRYTPDITLVLEK